MSALNQFDDAPLAIVVTGPVGSGKTTVANAISTQLDDAPRHVCVDMDALRQVSGWDERDPFWNSIGLSTFAELWRRAAEVGARVAVVADVVEHDEHRQDYLAAVPGAQVVVVRLDVPLELIADRLRQRMAGDPGLDWHLRRAPELHEIMTLAGVGDLVIEVGQRSAAEVAAEIIERVGLRPQR